MQIDHRGTNDNDEKLGQRGREGVTWPTFAVLVVKYFTYLKHTALDKLQVRLNVILFNNKYYNNNNNTHVFIWPYVCN